MTATSMSCRTFLAGGLTQGQGIATPPWRYSYLALCQYRSCRGKLLYALEQRTNHEHLLGAPACEECPHRYHSEQMVDASCKMQRLTLCCRSWKMFGAHGQSQPRCVASPKTHVSCFAEHLHVPVRNRNLAEQTNLLTDHMVSHTHNSSRNRWNDRHCMRKGAT